LLMKHTSDHGSWEPLCPSKRLPVLAILFRDSQLWGYGGLEYRCHTGCSRRRPMSELERGRRENYQRLIRGSRAIRNAHQATGNWFQFPTVHAQVAEILKLPSTTRLLTT
jgi:hypothetical protein